MKKVSYSYSRFFFKKGKNVTRTKKKNISAFYGEDAVNYWTCQKWFVKLYAGDFLLNKTLVG